MNIFVSVIYNVLLLLYYAHKSINATVSKVKKILCFIWKSFKIKENKTKE